MSEKNAPQSSDESPISEPARKIPLEEIKKVALVVIGIALLIAVFFIWQWNHHRNVEEKASALSLKANTPETWQAVLDQYPKSSQAPGALLNLAAFRWKKGDFSQAADFFQQFIRQFPEHPAATAAQLASAECFSIAGKTDQAREAYLKITQAPQHPFLGPASIGLAKIYQQEGLISNARQVLTEFINQPRPSAFLSQAQTLLSQLPASAGAQ